MVHESDLFKDLRRVVLGTSEVEFKVGTQLYYQLRAVDAGFLLCVTDRTGEPCEFDYRAFNGAERELLKAYAAVRWSWDDTGIWDDDGPSEGVLLRDHAHLMGLLARIGQGVDEQMEPLTFHPEAVTLRLSLSVDEKEWVRGTLEAYGEDGVPVSLDAVRPVTESYLLVGRTIYTIQPLGMGFASLPLFLERVTRGQLDEYLSLFFSTFSTLELVPIGFSVRFDEPVISRPALLFQQVDELSALHLEVTQTIQGFSPEFVRDYDLSRVAFLDELEGLIRVRDVDYGHVAAERAKLMKLFKKLSKRGKATGNYLVNDEEGLMLGPELASVFLQEHLADLLHRFDLYGAEKLKAYRIRQVQPKLDVRLDHGIDFLEGNAELDLGGERLSLFEALQQYRKNKYILLQDGTHAILDAAYMDRLTRLFQKKKEGVRVSFFDLPMIEELLEESARAQLPDSREVFRGFNTIGKRRLQLRRFVGTLRPYQIDGVKWLAYLHENKLGGCLADDMGLGKTIQAIALFSRIYPKEKKPTLVVMPRSLLFNWRHELETFAPSLSHYTYYGPSSRDLQEALKHQLILTTYGMLRSDVEAFSGQTYHAVVLDESQAIKNLKTQTSKAVLALKCSFRLALSGTPVENHLGELYALFRFLNPSMFGTGAAFERDYATPIQHSGDKVVAEELRHKIHPFLLRRLKKDVLDDLPDKVEQVLMVEMGEDQRKLYELRRRFYQEMVQEEIERHGLARSRFAVLEALLELRQLATVPEAKSDGAVLSAKRDMLADVLQEAVENGRKCLVFSNFLAGVEQACSLLNELGIKYLSMTGATADRAQLVERFQNDRDVKVFVMTLKTGGVGLNLTAADTVFIMDPWWNTSAEAQAVDRTHRIGQDKTVFTYRLIAKDTIEEKIMRLQKQKRELVDMVVSSDGAALKALSEADIDQLLGV